MLVTLKNMILERYWNGNTKAPFYLISLFTDYRILFITNSHNGHSKKEKRHYCNSYGWR
jgi:hypothetical protein